MFVHDVGLQLAQLRPEILEAIIGRRRAGIGDEQDFGMFFLERFGEARVTLNVLLAPLFISHAEHFQVERFRMPHRGPPGAPGAGSRAVGKLDQVQRVLDIRLKLVQRRQFAGVELAGHAAIQNRQRLRADVLAQLEELEKAQAKRLEIIRRRPVQKFIVPAVDEQLAIFDRTDGILPLVTPVQHAAFDDAAAGEPQEAGLQVREHLHHVRAQAAGAVLPRFFGEEGHHGEVNRAFAFQEERQPGVGVGIFGVQRRRAFFPIRGKSPQRHRVQQTAVGTAELHEQDWRTGHSANVRGEMIRFALANSHATKTLIGNSKRRRPFRPNAHIMGIGWSKRAVITNGYFPPRKTGADFGPAHQGLGKLERAVLDQLGAKPAVSAKVDVLEENSPHRGIDVRSQFIRPNFYGRHIVGVRS